MAYTVHGSSTDRRVNNMVKGIGKRASIALFLFFTSCSSIFPCKSESLHEWACYPLDCSNSNYLAHRCYLPPSCPLQGIGIDIVNVNGCPKAYLEVHRLSFCESSEFPGFVDVRLILGNEGIDYCLKLLKGNHKALISDEMLAQMYWAFQMGVPVFIESGRFQDKIPPFFLEDLMAPF